MRALVVGDGFAFDGERVAGKYTGIELSDAVMVQLSDEILREVQFIISGDGVCPRFQDVGVPVKIQAEKVNYIIEYSGDHL